VKRRKLIKALGAATVGGALVACKPKTESSNSTSEPKKTYNWKMVTAWPKNFPALGTGANYLAETITKMSGGRINITVYGGGELVPPLEVFDAVSNGTAQMGHAASYYWKGKTPEAQFFGAVPFGMNAQEMNAWLYHGGGLELWTELYAQFNLVPFPAGQTGVQMGGWFNKEINSK
jgi:TRAP-type mannitol/chloroaromatic compound transport system substrate-binding protein